MYEDRVLSRQLIKELRRSHTVLDPLTDLHVGETLDARMRDSVRQADKIIVVCSKNSQRLSYKNNFITIVQSERKDLVQSVILLLLDQAEPSILFNGCARLPFIDVRETATALEHLIGRERHVPEWISEPPRAGSDTALVAVQAAERVLARDKRVVGHYFRWDEPTVDDLQVWADRIERPFRGTFGLVESFLIGGSTGTGKSFFVQEIARVLGVKFIEMDFSDMPLPKIAACLSDVREATVPVLVLIDEVDTASASSEFYDQAFQILEKNHTGHPRVCVLLGSARGGSKAVRTAMLARPPKCADMAGRVPPGHCFDVPEPTLRDRIAFAGGLMEANMSGASLQRIEKFAAYYLLSDPELSTGRDVREFLRPAFKRFHDRGAGRGLLYDDLFEPGDPRGRDFMLRNGSKVEMLRGRYISFD
jgi:hypothetical protein